MELPPELRLLVYRHASTTKADDGNGKKKKKDIFYRLVQPAIACTSKQVRSEWLRAYYGEAHFCIEIHHRQEPARHLPTGPNLVSLARFNKMFEVFTNKGKIPPEESSLSYVKHVSVWYEQTGVTAHRRGLPVSPVVLADVWTDYVWFGFVLGGLPRRSTAGDPPGAGLRLLHPAGPALPPDVDMRSRAESRAALFAAVTEYLAPSACFRPLFSMFHTEELARVIWQCARGFAGVDAQGAQLFCRGSQAGASSGTIPGGGSSGAEVGIWSGLADLSLVQAPE